MLVERPLPGWRPSTPEIIGSEINVLTQRFPAVVIHFCAGWNSHDRTMDRMIVAIQEQSEGRVSFVSCDTDLPENANLCRRCRVVNIPALGVIVASEAQRTIIGLRQTAQLVGEIESRLISR